MHKKKPKICTCWKIKLEFSATILIIISIRLDHEGDKCTLMMMFSMLVSGYLTIAMVDGKPKEFFFSFFSCKKAINNKSNWHSLWWLFWYNYLTNVLIFCIFFHWPICTASNKGLCTTFVVYTSIGNVN